MIIIRFYTWIISGSPVALSTMRHAEHARQDTRRLFCALDADGTRPRAATHTPSAFENSSV